MLILMTMQHLVGRRVVDHVAGGAVGGWVLDGLRARQVAAGHLHAAGLAQHAPRAGGRAGQVRHRHLCSDGAAHGEDSLAQHVRAAGR